MNRIVAKLPFIGRMCMVEVLVARPVPKPVDVSDVTVSVIVPCKDERGNIESIVTRMPELARSTEIIFCDDKSTDGTADEVRRMQRLYAERNIRAVDGPGICKSKNVWKGFEAATGDILVILDADLTVMPEELPYFIDAITRGGAEFVNGSRLVYPIPKAAMKGANVVGNKLFSAVFSYLLGQRIKDTLCGTKVLWRSDWERIRPMIGTWGTIGPLGRLRTPLRRRQVESAHPGPTGPLPGENIRRHQDDQGVQEWPDHAADVCPRISKTQNGLLALEY